MNLDTFVEKAYAGHDPAHGREHVIRVLKNAEIIAEGMTLSPEEQKIFDWVMVGHDAADHKIPVGDRLSDEELAGIYTDQFGAELAATIIEIHENCSWSKRLTRKTVRYETLLKILQDADWIEAVGVEGLQRCIDFTIHQMPDANLAEICEAVCKHIREKLLLIPEGLNFEISPALADVRPLHKYLTVYG